MPRLSKKLLKTATGGRPWQICCFWHGVDLMYSHYCLYLSLVVSDDTCSCLQDELLEKFFTGSWMILNCNSSLSFMLKWQSKRQWKVLLTLNVESDQMREYHCFLISTQGKSEYLCCSLNQRRQQLEMTSVSCQYQ